MSEFMTLLLHEAESGWVWMYTAGMPDEDRANRVAELESDAWEHEAEAKARGERFGLQFLYRVVLGMPADASWRLQLGRRGMDFRNWLEALVACLLTLGLLVALPVAAVLLPSAPETLDRDRSLNLLVMAYGLFVILFLVLPGVLVIERWPIAGGLLVLIGCFCLMGLFWWLKEAMFVIVSGALAGAVSAVRLTRMPRPT